MKERKTMFDQMFNQEKQISESKGTHTTKGAKSTFVQSINEWIREFADKNINSLLIDERRTIPPHIVIEFGNKGLLGMLCGKEWGGLGLSLMDCVHITEQLSAIDTTLATFVGLNNTLGLLPILNHATPAMKQKILPPLAKGLELAAFAITETGAGSNPRNMSTTAKPDGNGGWIINGEKVWIGSAAWATYLNVFAKVVDENDQLMGITGFVVRKDAPGVTIGEEALTMGVRGMVQNKIYFKDVHVTAEDMLGEIGKGFEIAQEAMCVARLGICSVCLGAMKRCFNMACHYAQNRKIITGKLIDNPITLDLLKQQKIRIEIIETFLSSVTAKYDKKEHIPEELLMTAKIIGPEYLWDTVDETMQILGGRGYVETNAIPQIMRDARLLRIFEGPTETMVFYLGLLLSQKNSQFINTQLDYADLGQIVKKAQQIIIKRPKDLVRNRYYLGLLGSNVIAKSVLLEEDVLSPDTLCWLDKQIEDSVVQIEQERSAELSSTSSEMITLHNKYVEELGYNKGSAPDIDFEIDEFIKRRNDDEHGSRELK
jgi:alkylation response protein AidB-like acyl-CoA dehydrogenase